MRAILGTIIAVAVLWGGYWFWGAARVQGQTQAWMTEQGVSGEISVVGFPNRFDLTITNPDLQRDDIAYSAPFFQVFAMTWKPWHFIAAFAPTQKITVLDRQLTLSSPHLLASLLMSPMGSFRELRLDGSKFGVAATNAWRIDAAHVTAALDATGDPLSPRVGGRLTDFTTPVRVDGLNDLIELAALDANLNLRSPLDAAQTGQAILSIDVREARLNWGKFSLTATGSFAPDAQSLVSGEVTVTLKGADHLPQILVALGLITADQTVNLSKGLAVMGTRGQMTLTLSNGTIWNGPIPLGAAPAWPL